MNAIYSAVIFLLDRQEKHGDVPSSLTAKALLGQVVDEAPNGDPRIAPSLFPSGVAHHDVSTVLYEDGCSATGSGLIPLACSVHGSPAVRSVPAANLAFGFFPEPAPAETISAVYSCGCVISSCVAAQQPAVCPVHAVPVALPTPPVAPSVTVNVQAMDAQSVIDAAPQIAAALSEAAADPAVKS